MGPDRPPSEDAIERALWDSISDLQDSAAKLTERMDKQQMTDADWTAFREMLEADKRNRWLWASARTWAIWITAVVAGFTVGLDALRQVLKRLVS